VPSAHCVACNTPAPCAATRNLKRSNPAIAREFGTSEAAVRRHHHNHLAGHMPQGEAPPVDHGGRPSKFTDDRVQRLLAAIRASSANPAEPIEAFGVVRRLMDLV
jgi:hypothetical protein